MSAKPLRQRNGGTLVELLIVIAIFALLLQIAVPAVQMSREAARRTQCTSNLRQMALGMQLHVASHGHFPTGGWSHRWVGDPNRGYGEKQPGGWAYNLLPYIEASDVHDTGKGRPDEVRKRLATKMVATVVPLYVCPSRRDPQPLPYRKLNTPFNIDTKELEKAARSDYAASMGNALPISQGGEGPQTLEEGDAWQVGEDRTNSWVASRHNGVIYQRSKVTPAKIRDGISKTYLCGEKYVYWRDYKTEGSYADDQSLYIGFDRDNQRSVHLSQPPVQDKQIVTNDLWNFGSAHPNVFNMAFCDGSVHSIPYSIDSNAYAAMGSRDSRKDAFEE
jgi:prepilin-type processing-associated H-X9-DG protein